MQTEELRPDLVIDSKTAEETLALAIRLQQKAGDTVTLEQLRKTAEEVGIHSSYLTQALKQVQKAQRPMSEKVLYVGVRVALVLIICETVNELNNYCRSGEFTKAALLFLCSAAAITLLYREARRPKQDSQGRSPGTRSPTEKET